MRRSKVKWIFLLVLILIAGTYYYVTIPAFNIHSRGFWLFLLGFAVVGMIVYTIRMKFRSMREFRKSKGIKAGIWIMIGIGAFFLGGSALSSPTINANRYQQLMKPQARDFVEDIKQINYKHIPILDKDTAEVLGNRKMGNMLDMVSQFEVSTIYSQINYQGNPVRVSPLVYADTVKWFTNQSKGIPAYIKIDMATQDTELVHLEKPIRYSESDHLNRNIYRHLRFSRPTYIFDEISFEIDDDGTPYWICPVKQYKIGLFGGQSIGRVVLCNAQTGKVTDYTVENCPAWVERVFPADLIVQLYDYHGSLINGYFNSVFGQKGCLKTSDGYNYLAMDNDMWVYTGITSVNSDESNVGFILVNQRTMETRYYAVNGAGERSAMASAEGQVQHLGYKAVFPLILNISNEPTYLIALKDGAGLVKKYAMVNIQKYQNVAVGNTVAECEKEYALLLSSNDNVKEGDNSALKASGMISKIAQSVVGGNSHFYITLSGRSELFDISFADFMEIVTYDVGDRIAIEYIRGNPLCLVTKIAKNESDEGLDKSLNKGIN